MQTKTPTKKKKPTEPRQLAQHDVSSSVPAKSEVADRAHRETTSSSVPAKSEIADRAYHLFVQRGGEHGRDWEDWLQAERELASQSR